MDDAGELRNHTDEPRDFRFEVWLGPNDGKILKVTIQPGELLPSEQDGYVVNGRLYVLQTWRNEFFARDFGDADWSQYIKEIK